MSAEEPLLPLIPGTNGTANPLTNGVQSAIDRMIGRRAAALGYGYTYPQSWIFWPQDGSSPFNGVAIQGTNAASSVLNVNGKITAIDATGVTLRGGTNWTTSSLSGPVGIPFDNTPAILSGPGQNTYLPTSWYFVIGHHAYDTTSEEMFAITQCFSNTGRLTFANTNQLGNLFTANVYSGTNDIVGRPGSIIGYSYAAPRHRRVLPYADHRSLATGNVASVAAMTNAAGVVVLPAGPAPGIIRTDGLRLDISQCRGNQFRVYDTNGVYRAATVAATSTAQVVYLSGSPTWTANVTSPVWCGPATARATAGKDVGNALEFYRGVTTGYIGLDLDDSIANALKPAANYGVMTAEPDGMGGTICQIDNVPRGVFDVDYNTTNGLENIDESVTICSREVDHFVAQRFYWTLRGKQNRIRTLASGSWVRDPGTNAVTAIPTLNFAELDLDASTLFPSFGLTNTINVHAGTCTAVVGFSGTNEGSNNQVTTSVVPPYVPVRCDVSFHPDNGDLVHARGVYTGSNTITLSDSVTVGSGTANTCVNGRAMVVTFGESSVEANQVRAPWADSTILIPDVGGDPPGVLPISYSSAGSFSFLAKSQSLLSRRSDVADYNTPQGYAVENSDSINAFTNRTLACFVGSNFMQPGIRAAGNVFFTGDGPADAYYVRHHVGLISQTNPAHQGVRDSLRSGTVVTATAFSLTTAKDFTLDPVWGGVATSFTSSNTTATTTSVTFTAPGTATSYLFPQYGTHGLSLQIDTGTGTNAGLWNPAYRVDRVTSGIASSGANLVVSFTNSASGLAGLPTKLSLPWKLSPWKDYILNVTPASGGTSWTARVAANTDGTFFFPTTTNTINAGDRWRVGYLDGHDMLGTGTVIECDASGTPGSWTFKTGGADQLRLFVSSPQDFLPDPHSNLEGFTKRYGPAVPGTANLIECDNEMVMRLLAMKAYLGPNPGFDDNGGSNRAEAGVLSPGAGAGVLSSTNTLTMMLAAADSVAAGGSASPWDAAPPLGIDTNEAPPQATAEIVWGKDGSNPANCIQNTAAGFITTVARVSVTDVPTLRAIPVTTKVYLFFQMNAANDDQVTAYGSPTDPAGECGGGTLELFAPPFGVSGAEFRKYVLVGTTGGATSIGGIVGVVGSLSNGPWPAAPSTTTYNLILDPITFMPTACGTNVQVLDGVFVNAGYYSPGGKSVVVPSYSAAAAAGF